MKHPRDELAKSLGPFGPGPLFVHSDLLAARSFVEKFTSREDFLLSHHQLLTAVAGDRSLWTPCFNYDFTKTGLIDLHTAPCQVGPLGEFRRLQPSIWRSPDPVFSVCGNGLAAIEDLPSGRCVAFDQQSIFAELHRRDGTLLFYGAPFASATIVHYAEGLTGGPIYRYDKTFSGTLVNYAGTESQVEYVYHVRPWERHLDYDWPRLVLDARDAGIVREVTNGNQVVARLASARELVDYWVAALKQDPFYLLDDRSREWVTDFYGNVNRRFEISDFEQVHV